MTYKELVPYLKYGKIGKLPNYQGYFYWDYPNNCIYMKNKDYINYELSKEKARFDWYYII